MNVYNDLTGLRWLRKYFKDRVRRVDIGLYSWAGEEYRAQNHCLKSGILFG